jgi:hypothetical protein
MLQSMIEGAEHERAANQAAAVEDAGEEEGGRLGQEGAVDIDERDRRGFSEHGPRR